VAGGHGELPPHRWLQQCAAHDLVPLQGLFAEAMFGVMVVGCNKNCTKHCLSKQTKHDPRAAFAASPDECKTAGLLPDVLPGLQWYLFAPGSPTTWQRLALLLGWLQPGGGASKHSKQSSPKSMNTYVHTSAGPDTTWEFRIHQPVGSVTPLCTERGASAHHVRML
jgi:hypothetical protein